ncbi:hypothetical protein ACM66B_003750 [Microbotryomycetes sp. NB124-2]
MLKECQVARHVKEFKGKTLAVDAYVWLHRGAYSCPEQLATGQATTKYVNYAMHRVRMLRHFGVEPYLVFDGAYLPSKSGTEDDRGRRRAEALARATSLVAEGKSSLARDAFVKAVDVTPEMAYQLIKALRKENVQYVVAPYEADPQLAYLEQKGIVDGVISEDSDLLVFGCKTVLFKLDGEGQCVSICRDDFTRCREYNFSGWTDSEFRQMAILSGCDYLESIPGMGIKTAHRLMRRYKTGDKVIQFVRLEGQLKVPRTYQADFKRAELTFLHQHVFDPVQQVMTHLTPPPANANLDFVGAAIDPSIAPALASGDLNPMTREPIVDLTVSAGSSLEASTSKETLDLAPEQMFPTTSKAFAKAATASTSRQPAGRPAVEVEGKGSITSFFKPITPMSTSKSSQKATKPTTKGKEKAIVERPVDKASPKKASKFFAGRVVKEVANLSAAPRSSEDLVSGSGTALSEAPTSKASHGSGNVCAPVQASQQTSPMSTPPRAPVSKRLRDSPSSARSVKRERTDRNDPFLQRVLSSDCAISSPQDFGMAVKEPLSEVDELPESVAHVSSPARLIKRDVKLEADVEKVKSEANTKFDKSPIKKKEIEFSIELSSDPITFTSDASAPVIKRKPPPRRSNAFVPGSSIRKIEKTSSKRKRNEAHEDDAEDDEDAQEASIRSSQVANAWKAKFMLKSATTKTPKATAMFSDSSSLPTPTSLDNKKPASSAAQTAVSSSKLKTVTKSFSRTTGATPRAAVGARTPLSPKSINRGISVRDSKSLPGMTSSSSSPPCQPLRPATTTSEAVSSEFMNDLVLVPATSPMTEHRMTLDVNPRLLKFKFVPSCAN